MKGFVFAAITAVLLFHIYKLWGEIGVARRKSFIRHYPWPTGLLDKLAAHRPEFTRKETALVAEGLRQFFIAYLKSGRRYVAMPSQVADELWHEFILYTRAYDEFCSKAFGGFLHHTPAVVLSPSQRRSNEGLRRVWHWACREENIHPKRPTRLPLLFALDAKLKIPNGFYYTPDCSALRALQTEDKNTSLPYCGGDFSRASIDGSTLGFDGGAGDISSAFGGDSGGGDSGGGCGGGCGGGGD